MSKYVKQRISAARKLKEKGALILLRRTVHSDSTPDVYDPLTDTTTPGTPAADSVLEQQAYALVMPPTTQTEQTYQTQFEAGTMRRSDIKKLMIANARVDDISLPLRFPPDEGLVAVFEDQEWTFLGLLTQAPDGGEPIYFDATVKR